jgi:hypothetical protein
VSEWVAGSLAGWLAGWVGGRVGGRRVGDRGQERVYFLQVHTISAVVPGLCSGTYWQNSDDLYKSEVS